MSKYEVTVSEVREAYRKTKESGMFWEFHPEMTGIWEEDKDEYIDFAEKVWGWTVTDRE